MIDINLSGDLKISRIVQGHWRLASWKLSPQELLSHTLRAVDLGVNTFDHADIYGDYSCEKVFGEVFSLSKGVRSRIRLITKCGINLLSAKYPERRLKHYDYSYGHITGSVENSLRNFKTDYIDLLLLHRPAPLFDPDEVSRAFNDLHKSGKVLHFGVSNFLPLQFEMLNSRLEKKLVTNQIEISPSCLDHFINGNIDFLLKERIKPLAWSPLAQGRLTSPDNEKGRKVYDALKEVASELEVESLETIAYGWLLHHPVSIIPIAGTSRIDRLQNALAALNLSLTTEQWYRIYTASTGMDVP
jgi:predicted oxidoreductase